MGRVGAARPRVGDSMCRKQEGCGDGAVAGWLEALRNKERYGRCTQVVYLSKVYLGGSQCGGFSGFVVLADSVTCWDELQV